MNPMTRVLRSALALIILLVCVTATVHLFDWHTIGRALIKLHVWFLLGTGIPLILVASAMRGWRWLVVLGVPHNRANFWQSFCANGAASGLASFTPFQIGEVIKIRMIPKHHGKGWRLGVSAFFLERILDLGTLCSIGLGGLAIHFDHAWLAPLILLLPLGGCLALSLLCRSLRLPEKLLPYTEALRHTPRVVMAAALSVPLWLLYVALWWVATHAIDIPLDPSQVAILLGGVMLAVVVSMTPGGLGVSELGSRSVLLWLGVSAANAEIGAIAIRLLTPMIAIVGMACLVPLLCKKKEQDRSLKRIDAASGR